MAGESAFSQQQTFEPLRSANLHLYNVLVMTIRLAVTRQDPHGRDAIDERTGGQRCRDGAHGIDPVAPR